MFPCSAPLQRGYQGFPRIRGDVPPKPISPKVKFWFSPHTRGCSAVQRLWKTLQRVFPAYAGMFLVDELAGAADVCFPRIRGDVPQSKPGHTWYCSFSPHTRGCSVSHVSIPRSPTVFPAYAGMFHPPGMLSNTRQSFPRIRGDVPDFDLKRIAEIVFSPHTRGCS